MTTLRLLTRSFVTAPSARSARHRATRPRPAPPVLRALLLAAVLCVATLAAGVSAVVDAVPADATIAGLPVAAASTEPLETQTFSLALSAQTGTIWTWPTEYAVLRRGYEAPAHRYGTGHRGIDVDAASGSEVRSVDDGVVRFAGMVAGRPVVSVDHGDGLVSSLEPVVPEVVAGQRVQRGEVLGTVGESGHCTGCLHLGARLDGEYLSPLALLGGVPRAVLLPLD